MVTIRGTFPIMKTILLVIAILALAVPAHGAGSKTLRVDRPEKGAGAKVTTVRLVKGTVARRMRAVVLTDMRCNPDAQGVSHCLNDMRLANGAVVRVVHDHRMATMPCLAPGEQVTITPR